MRTPTPDPEPGDFVFWTSANRNGANVTAGIYIGPGKSGGYSRVRTPKGIREGRFVKKGTPEKVAELAAAFQKKDHSPASARP